MTEITPSIPPRLQEIVEDFQWSEDREKLEQLLEFSERMPSLPDWLQADRSAMESVPECMTPVSVQSKVEDGKMTFYFDAPPQSPTVRGFAALMAEGVHGATPEQILSIPADFYQQMGLERVLTNQRLNGISAILAHMKRLALQAMQG
jgi:cysteine desulfuration protein SufE